MPDRGTVIVFPDTSAAGKVRFYDALLDHGAIVRRSWAGPPQQFLVGVDDPDAFAASCGTFSSASATTTAPSSQFPPKPSGALWILDLGVLWTFGRDRYKIERRISRRTIRGEYI